MQRRLWIIDPCVATPEEQGVERVLEGWAGASRLFRPALSGDGPGPETGYETDGIVLMGSAASPHDRLPWVQALGLWLDPILRGEVVVPLLGICFGHQLIAVRAGGQVEFSNTERTKQVGVERTRLDGGRLLPGQHELSVVVSHREQVTSVPPDFRVVARRAGVQHDGIEHCRLPVFSFQFHPEAGAEFARRAGIEPRRLEGAVAADSRRLLSAFRSHVAGDEAQ